jgi:hypothetical protein
MNEHVALKRPADAYETDVYAWTRAQAELLRAGRFDLLDTENIVEEIESLGSEQLHAIESHLLILGEHLIKLLVSPDRDPRQVWKRSVREARRQIARRLRRNPSLRPLLPDLIAAEWKEMVDEAVDGLRTDAERAHATLLAPFSPGQMLDPDFFPGD